MLKREVDYSRLLSHNTYQPLGLDPWTEAFDLDGNLDLTDSEYMDEGSGFSKTLDSKRRSSYQLAIETAELNVERVHDTEMRDMAIAGLMTTLTDQAGRNSRYCTTEAVDRLRDQYGTSEYPSVLFGKADPAKLANAVLENDDKIVSLEVARYSHVNRWSSSTDVNSDIYDHLMDSTEIMAEKVGKEPRYKIKGFYDRAVLVERKRHVMHLLGGKAVVVKRLNFLIDKEAESLPDEIDQHITNEVIRLLDRQAPMYDFNAENDILHSQLEDKYVGSAASRDSKIPDFILPLQTGYYVYSPEALKREKQLEYDDIVQREVSALATRERWSSDWL